jgi:dTDP-4-dehydrorhamnose 3,5-epimerase
VRFEPTPIAGAWLISLQPAQDERGFFARSFCEREFAEHGVHDRFVQANLSRNRTRGTLRGMHYQDLDHPEPKVVRCVKGAVFDAMVDLRRGSPSYLKTFARRLDDEAGDALYVPAGCAHGFLTLSDDADVEYLMGAFFEPGAGKGVRWNDPAFSIDWPSPPSVISGRDAGYPDYEP